MIIRSFSIDRFGILAGQEAGELAPGLNIFLGDNEAGKSTLLNFFRAMFFGYKRDGKNDKLDYLASGSAAAQSGGSLALTAGDGGRFSLLRRPGSHGGELSLSDEAGRALPSSFLAGLLGDYTAKMYDQVFCFGYSDLASLSGMSDESVAGALHAAAFGTGFKSPLEVSRALAARQDKLFAPRASSRPVNRNLKRQDEIRSELARLGSELDRYQALKEGREVLEASLAALKAESLELALSLERRQSLLAAWDDWQSLLELRADLALHPHPGGEYALESLERFEEMLFDLDALRAEIKEKNSLLAQGSEALERRGELAALVAVWPDCESLMARKGSLENALAAVPRLEEILVEGRERLSALARGIGPDWDARRVVEFDITLNLQNGVDVGRQSLEAAQRAVDQAGAEAARLEAEFIDARKEAEAARLSLGQGAGDSQALYTAAARAGLEARGLSLEAARLAAAEAEKRLEALREEEGEALDELGRLGAALGAAREAAAEVSDRARAARKPALLGSLKTARQDTRRVPPMLLCLAAAALCFAGTYEYFSASALGQDGWQKFTSREAWELYLAGDWRAFGLGLACLWGAFFWLAPRAATFGRWQPKDGQGELLSPEERAAQSEADAVLGQYRAGEAQLARLRAAQEKAGAACAGFLEEAGRAARAWAEEAALYGFLPDCPMDAALRLFDLCLKTAQAARKHENAAVLAEGARLRRLDAEDEWRRWLAGQGFSPDFTPETVRQALVRMAQIQEQAAALGGREAELLAVREEIGAFVTALEALCRRVGFSPEGGSPPDRFDSLYRAASEARAESLRLDERLLELQKLKAEVERLDELLRGREERLAAIIKQGEAADAVDYAVRFKAQAGHTALREREERLLARLEQAAARVHAAGGQRLWAGLDDFFVALSGSSAPALNEEVASMQAALSALESERAEKQTALGENKANIAGLESGQHNEALRAEESALKDELRGLAREWGVLVLARNFIRRARRRFEEERHDSVIRQAGEIFSGLTGGRYNQLVFDQAGGGYKACAVTKAGESLDSESALSQGTREQLYLALRLAFIRQHNQTKESLPLIMDDILVNFDPARAARAAEIFTAFSAGNQLMFFTCHPSTAELLRQVSPQSKLFSIKSGRIARAK